MGVWLCSEPNSRHPLHDEIAEDDSNNIKGGAALSEVVAAPCVWTMGQGDEKTHQRLKLNVYQAEHSHAEKVLRSDDTEIELEVVKCDAKTTRCCSK